MPDRPCVKVAAEVRMEIRPKQSEFYPTILVGIRRHAETDEKGGLRAHGDEASGRARGPGRMQRQGCGRGLRDSAGSAGEDPATAGEGRFDTVAAWHARRLHADAGCEDDYRVRGDQGH